MHLEFAAKGVPSAQNEVKASQAKLTVREARKAIDEAAVSIYFLSCLNFLSCLFVICALRQDQADQRVTAVRLEAQARDNQRRKAEEEKQQERAAQVQRSVADAAETDSLIQATWNALIERVSHDQKVASAEAAGEGSASASSSSAASPGGEPILVAQDIFDQLNQQKEYVAIHLHSILSLLGFSCPFLLCPSSLLRRHFFILFFLIFFFILHPPVSFFLLVLFLCPFLSFLSALSSSLLSDCVFNRSPPKRNFFKNFKNNLKRKKKNIVQCSKRNFRMTCSPSSKDRMRSVLCESLLRIFFSLSLFACVCLSLSFSVRLFALSACVHQGEKKRGEDSTLPRSSTLCVG